jgi:hypothetical protein
MKALHIDPLKTNKAQMEIIGLVVIVILLTLGMLFLAMFALNEDTSKKIFTRKGLATSTATALLKTNVECTQFNGEKVSPYLGKDVLEDCAKNYDSPFCTIYSCNNQHCCAYFNETTKQFLNSTLGKWNKKYEFEAKLIYKQATPITLSVIKSKKGGCPKTKPRDTSGLNPLTVEGGGLIETILYLCD